MSKIQVDDIVNKDDNGAPSFPYGAVVTGVVTATSLSVTDITATGNVSIAGTLTYEDVTNVDSIGIITAQSGIDVTGGDINVGTATTITDGGLNVTGVITATSFSGDGSSVTNVNATTLDTIDSGSFLRSDAADTKTSGDLSFDDNIKANFGTGSDLEIYHDGNHSIIKDGGTGNLILMTSDISIVNSGNTEYMIHAIEDNQVELYFNGSKKLETTTSGVTVTGTLNASGIITAEAGAIAEIDTLTSASTVTPDFAASCNFTLTLGTNVLLENPSNLTAGQSGSIFLIQDGTGSRTLSFGTYWDFAGGVPPTISTVGGSVDRLDYIVRSSTSIHAVVTLAYS